MRYLILVFLLCFSCKKVQKNSSFKDSYKVNIGYKLDTINKLNEDILYIFFETDFEDDLLKTTYKGNLKEYKITTDRSTGYADFMNLGKLSNFDEIKFSINNGKEVKLTDIKTNLIKVNYFKGESVNVRFDNSPKAYQ